MNTEHAAGERRSAKRAASFQAAFYFSCASLLMSCDPKAGNPGSSSTAGSTPASAEAPAASPAFADPGLIATPTAASTPRQVELGDAPRLPR